MEVLGQGKAVGEELEMNPRAFWRGLDYIWTELYSATSSPPPPKYCVEASIPSVTACGDRAFRKVITVKGGHKGGALTP